MTRQKWFRFSPVGAPASRVDDGCRVDPHAGEEDLAPAPLVHPHRGQAELVDVEGQRPFHVGDVQHDVVESGDPDRCAHVVSSGAAGQATGGTSDERAGQPVNDGVAVAVTAGAAVEAVVVDVTWTAGEQVSSKATWKSLVGAVNGPLEMAPPTVTRAWPPGTARWSRGWPRGRRCRRRRTRSGRARCPGRPAGAASPGRACGWPDRPSARPAGRPGPGSASHPQRPRGAAIGLRSAQLSSWS